METVSLEPYFRQEAFPFFVFCGREFGISLGMEADMQIGIIGASKVATTLGKYTEADGGRVASFYSSAERSGRMSA